jgi:hypothetical protein
MAILLVERQGNAESGKWRGLREVTSGWRAQQPSVREVIWTALMVFLGLCAVRLGKSFPSGEFLCPNRAEREEDGEFFERGISVLLVTRGAPDFLAMRNGAPHGRLRLASILIEPDHSSHAGSVEPYCFVVRYRKGRKCVAQMQGPAFGFDFLGRRASVSFVFSSNLLIVMPGTEYLRPLAKFDWR